MTTTTQPQMTEAKSSTIHSHGYDEPTSTMTIKFHSGSTYRYEGVSPEDYAAFAGAESVGKHFGAHIRNKYSGSKV